MIEELYKQITFFQTDIACCSYTKDKKRILSSQVERNKVSVVLSPKESLSLILEEQYFKGFVWNKLFSKSTLSFPKKILFDETIQYCEDLLFCCQAFSQSKKISYENKELYHYFVNDNSISKNNFSSKKITSLTALKKVIFLIDNDDLKCKQKFETYYINMALSLLMHGIESKEITKSEKEKLLDSLYSIKLSNIKNIKIKLFCLLSRLNVNLSYTTWKLLKN